jgi:hypothetical protein
VSTFPNPSARTLLIQHSRNNFIVGQVTPDMIKGISYGTYILFGLLTYMGAAFIWFFVPETKRLSLEEMVRSRGPNRVANC